MSNTFYLASAPEFYGSDVTEDQAAVIGQAVAEAVEERFEVKVELVRNSRDNSESDESGSIQQWVNDNWADIAGQVVSE